jgi:hypothetical protein
MEHKLRVMAETHYRLGLVRVANQERLYPRHKAIDEPELIDGLDLDSLGHL